MPLGWVRVLAPSRATAGFADGLLHNLINATGVAGCAQIEG